MCRVNLHKLTQETGRPLTRTYKRILKHRKYGNIQTSSEDTAQGWVLQSLYPRGSQNQARLHQHGQVGNKEVHRQFLFALKIHYLCSMEKKDMIGYFDAILDEKYGKAGTPEREQFRKEARAYCECEYDTDTTEQ